MNDAASITLHGGFVIKRFDRSAWEAHWNMDLDEQMWARVAESRRWPLMAPLTWLPHAYSLVHRFVVGRKPTVASTRRYVEMCGLQGRLGYLRDIKPSNLIVQPDWSLCLIDFWIDLTRWK